MNATGTRLLAVIGSWLAGFVIVVVGLAWADSYPYSAASEVRFAFVAIVALSTAIAGTVAALLWRRPRP